MPTIKEAWELIWEIYEKAKGTAWEAAIPILVGIVVLTIAIKAVIMPIGKLVVRTKEYILQKWFVKKQVYEKLSFMGSSDLYYAIKNYVPTRYSRVDPSNNDEPIPEYTALKGEKEPLLLEHFLKYEYDFKYGGKYYLCLGDCGMGKTTFMVNLYYQTLKLHKYNCVFISLQEENCIEKIEQIDSPADTILLLDGLDENEYAQTDYKSFSQKLEKVSRNFYRVIISARTNFFDSEAKEQISSNKSTVSMTDKLTTSRKFYISPFTDEDIRKFLKYKYRFNQKKYRQAWEIAEKNKNLSVRPMLLKFMDDLLDENNSFNFDFQLYEYLFNKWIEREKRTINEELGKGLYDECLLMAKEIYYQWLKNGKVGISLEEIKNRGSFSGIEAIQLSGHALINRTSTGIYKFSHKSYWEYLLAKLALSDSEFLEDLYIKNFDRATAFLEEMIQYNEQYEIQDINAIIGHADYVLKYKKIEDAEQLLNAIILTCSESESTYLVTLIKIAKCYMRQMKYASAKMYLDKAKKILDCRSMNGDNIGIFADYALAFAKYSRAYYMPDGQEILDAIIFFCEANGIYNYHLLECYNEYCCCCISLWDKQKKINKMALILEEYFDCDQYAKYIYIKASSWKLSYRDRDLLEALTQQIRQNSRFMDAYELTTLNCDLAISVYGYYHKIGKLEEYQEEALEYFKEANSIAQAIYGYCEVDLIGNPYILQIQQKKVLAVSFIHSKKVIEVAEPIMDYVERNNSAEEMKALCCRIYARIGDDELEEFSKREKYLLSALELVKGNVYREVDIYWSLYYLYDSNDKYELGQKYLYNAYILVEQNIEDACSMVFCGILRIALEFYDGEIDRERIVRTLLDIVPQVYGDDSRKKTVYSALRRFLSKTNDIRLIGICKELLVIEYNYETLDTLYNACNEHFDEKMLSEVINEIVKNRISMKKTISIEESNVFEDFCKEKSIYIEYNEKDNLNHFIDKDKRRRGGI